jgi:cytochrome P450 family 142 subfamily A polypeptide 1
MTTTNMSTTEARRINLLDRDLYSGNPHPTYAWLRDEAPCYWSEAAGLWGVSRYDDVVALERNSEVFSNAVNGSRPNTPRNSSMIDQDDPRHKMQRRFVAQGFTPSAIKAKEEHVRSICRSLIDGLIDRGGCDLVHELAAPLPTILIAEMLGVRPEDRDVLQRWMDTMIGAADGGQYVTDAVAEAHMEFVVYTLEVMEARRAAPADDLISTLVSEEIDAEKLDDDALVSEALLLLVGGGETTRNVISGGMEMLLRDPQQRDRLAADPSLIPAAVEESLRWVSPILNMNRTATRDFELHGETMREGDQVLLMYASANRDPAVFDAPETFDATRTPNLHLAFGFGPHFCLGSSLARLEIRVMFEELLARLPTMQLASDEPLPRSWSSFIRGPRRMPVVW